MLKSSIGRKYGFKRQLMDHRDFKYALIKPQGVVLPSSVDLSGKCGTPFNQGQLGSCTANALAGAMDFIRQGLIASRLFIYYNERVIEDTVSYDAGANLRDGIKSLASQGVCRETLWAYDVFKFAVKPPQACYDLALKDVIKSYHALDTLDDMKSCLAEGFPFVFGFTVYPEMESADVARNGIVPMPKKGESPLGGHAVMAVGYDDETNLFKIMNSWGPLWGKAGFFFLPYDYLSNPNLASDLWTVRS